MKTRKQLMACVLSFALLLGMIPTAEASAAKKVSLSTKKLTITTGKSKTLKVKDTKKKVIWKILSGKKYITLKKKTKVAVTIKGKKKGTAKVQAKIGSKKLTCTVTVTNAKEGTNTPKPSNKPVPIESTEPAITTPPVTTEEPTNTPFLANPTYAPEGANEQDVAALTALINEQYERGAKVSKDLSNSDAYEWEDGRLTKIRWENTFINGDISFSSFTELEVLNCGRNELTDLDVSSCEALTSLNCNENQISSLDVSKNVNLGFLDCRNNQLSSLNVSKNVNLYTLCCDANQLSSLDLSKNVDLDTLWCSNNRLSSLDVSKNVNLKDLDCEGNQLSNLDLTYNTKLRELVCDDDVTVIGYDKKNQEE